jgi:hypothetical protein
MRTGKSVGADGPKSPKVQKLDALLLGNLHGKVRELIDRIERGSVNPQWAVNELQCVIEGQKRVLAKKWKEYNGDFFLTVRSDGTSGEGWIRRLEQGKKYLCEESKRILRGPDFQATNGKEIQVVIVPAELFWLYGAAATLESCGHSHFLEYAKRRSFKNASLETACLVRELLSDNDMEVDMGLRSISVLPCYKRNDDADLGLFQIRVPSEPNNTELNSVQVYGVWGSASLTFPALQAVMFEVPSK